MGVQRPDLSARLDDLVGLEEYGLRRTLEGYYYIAHYKPLRCMEEQSDVEAVKLLESFADSETELYFHFPFCEVKCSFCHFYKELTTHGFAGDEQRYIAALSKELQQSVDVIGKIRARSLYIGGGTPSLMSNDCLATLLTNIRNNSEIADGAEVKFEVFPKRYEHRMIREKLRILKEFGFTDLVLDLESGNQASLNAVGRRSSSMDSYLELLDLCIEAGFKSIVTALIIGMPGETEVSLIQTLETLYGIPEVKVINTFPLITRFPDPIWRQVRSRPERFHSAESRDALWRLSRNWLREKGFTEGPISYLRRGDKVPQQQQDKFECVNLLGLGPSAFGYANGDGWAAQYFNVCNLKAYFSRVDNSRPALWRAGRMNNEERARRKLIFGLANCKAESLQELERTFGISVDEVFGQTLNALLSLGLIEVDSAAEGIQYTELGLSRLEEISFFLGSQAVKDSCAPPSEHHPDRLELIRHHYYVDVPVADQAKFEKFESSQSSSFMSRISRECITA